MLTLIILTCTQLEMLPSPETSLLGALQPLGPELSAFLTARVCQPRHHRLLWRELPWAYLDICFICLRD